MSALRSKLNPEFKSQTFDADTLEFKMDFSKEEKLIDSDSSKETKKVDDFSRFDSD